MTSNPDDQKDLELETVLKIRDPAVLTIAESILRGADIPYLAVGKGIQDLFGFGTLTTLSPLIGPVRLQVRAEDLEAAQEVLVEMLANDE